jgi:acyl-coenzyme A thioesterase PaaI-like protein
VLGSIEQGEPRNRPIEYMKKHMFDSVPDDGMPMRHFPDCFVSGLGNPMGVAINTRRDGDEAIAQVVIDAAFEGAPGRAHGGIVAAIFDDVMGYVLSILRTPAYTGRLSISYRAPTPMYSELEFRGWLHHRSGRKLLLRSRATHGSTVIAEAEGLFIAIPLERFGIRPGGAGS